jgi:hypothetical protein
MARNSLFTVSNPTPSSLRRQNLSHQVAVQHKLELARVIGDITVRWKIIPGDDTRLGEVMDTVMHELLRRPRLSPRSGPVTHPANRDLEGVRNASPPEIFF